MSFSQLGLCESLVNATVEKGYTKPSPIQLQSIPAMLKKANLLACAQTGTGKTAGFTLPMLELLSRSPSSQNGAPRALILAPTRELAVQIHGSIVAYGQHLTLSSTVVFGGVKANRQINRLARGVDILIATPGRLLDLVQQGAVSLKQIEILVLDEADRMLDMGFIHDIKRVIKLCPHKRQNCLFSATFTQDVRQFAKEFMANPVEINISPEVKTAAKVVHKIHPVDKKKKAELLNELVQMHSWFQALVFCRTKHGADKLVKLLNFFSIQALAIHGNKSQLQRTNALSRFKEGKLQILVATDIAARGIDIKQLPQVVNFDLPDTPEDYVHRIGRTGRAGAAGEAISLVCADEVKQLHAIEKLLNQKIQREYVPGFEPLNEIPEKVTIARKPSTRKHKPGARQEQSTRGKRKPASKKKPSRAPSKHGKRQPTTRRSRSETKKK